MDSRLSGGSTQSEVLSGDKKKKKGLFGKFKKLTKSRSIDDANGSQEDFSTKGVSPRENFERKTKYPTGFPVFQSVGGSDSDMSVAGDSDPRGSKKDLKDRISGMFKKGSSSRSSR